MLQLQRILEDRVEAFQLHSGLLGSREYPDSLHGIQQQPERSPPCQKQRWCYHETCGVALEIVERHAQEYWQHECQLEVRIGQMEEESSWLFQVYQIGEYLEETKATELHGCACWGYVDPGVCQRLGLRARYCSLGSRPGRQEAKQQMAPGCGHGLDE